MKTPKVLLIRNSSNISRDGYVTLPKAALKDAHKSERPVVLYIKPAPYSNFPTVGMIWRTPEDIKDAYIKSEWIPHELKYNGFMRNKADGYWLSQMKVKHGELQPVPELPKYAQKAIEKHQRRTGGKR